MIELFFWLKRCWKLATGQYLVFETDFSKEWNKKFREEVALERVKLQKKFLNQKSKKI